MDLAVMAILSPRLKRKAFSPKKIDRRNLLSRCVQSGPCPYLGIPLTQELYTTDASFFLLDRGFLCNNMEEYILKELRRDEDGQDAERGDGCC
jgi:hypothetical protein